MIKAGEVDNTALDGFLEQIIIPRFEKAQKNKIRLTTAVFIINPLFAGKVPAEIVDLFNSRGFRMEFECEDEDRPCGDCYYELEIPPQVEDSCGFGKEHGWNK
jgi:hypothetical protein